MSSIGRYENHRIERLLLLAITIALITMLATAPLEAQESGASLPDLMGDNFDGVSRTIQFTIPFSTSFHANGVILTTNDQTILALERDFQGFPDDLFATPAIDANGNPIRNTFTINGEPIPPSEVPTSPGPGFVFDGGTAIFTGSQTQTTPSANPLPPPGENGTYFVDYSFSQFNERIVSSGGGLAVRRVKLTENNSPIPTDRVFFNFNFFNDVPGGLNDVSRYTLGFEKTFWNQNASFEFRVPFAATLDSLQDLDTLGTRNVEAGNAIMIWKYLIYRNRQFAWTAGTGLTLPIASGAEFTFRGTNILQIANDSPHFLPFFAGAWTPNSRMFAQGFVQFDIDPYGNRVSGDVPDFADFPVGQRRLPQIGIVNDASLLFVDLGVGGWVFQNPQATAIRGLALMGEYHYTTTLNDADIVQGNGILLTDVSRRTDILNLSLGAHLYLRNGGEVTNGFVLPIRRGADRPFDFEYVMQWEHQF